LNRTRTVTWSDPQAIAQASRTMSGVDFLRAIMRGEVAGPPIALLLGLAIDKVDEGRVVFSVEPKEYLYNPAATVHGGVATTTVELKVNFVRPIVEATGKLRCEGTVIHAGGRIATAESRVTDAAGALYAHATTTCLIMRPDKGREG
jgi:acyl-coenzyme A thioesterase PaaI-like protein